jgi:hypothetical protein
LYDVTTLHFEADQEDDLRKVGYSKERRVDPTDRGRAARRTGRVPAGNRLLRRQQGGEAHAAADHRGVPGPPPDRAHARVRRRRDAVRSQPDRPRHGYKFIVRSRLTKAPIDLESHFRWHGDAFTDGQVIDTLTPKIGTNADNDPLKRAEPIWDAETHPGSWRAVWAYSSKRAVRDNQTLTAQENRARAVVAGETAARTPRFVKTAKTGLALDETALARAHRLVRLKGYLTNIDATIMPAAEVIASYHDLWRVEQSFRMTKSDLAARPLFARTRDAIEAHLTVVFAALAVSRTVQNRTGLSLRRVLRTLKPLRSAVIEINGLIQTIPPAHTPDQAAILNALNDPAARRQAD